MLLKPILSARSIAASASAARASGRAEACWPPTRSTAPSPISAHGREIWEVIVTGGDPFLLSPRRIAAIVRRLDAIPHVAVIRFHTRVPVVDPRRVRAELVAALAAEKAVYVVVHANHPRELTPAMREAVGRLVRAGIPVLSQSALLRGVNDDAAVLEALFRGLVAMRVKPYYLHHPDLAPRHRPFPARHRRGPAAGAAHCAAASPGCASRPMCSTSRAARAKCRSAPARRAPGGGAGERPRTWIVTDRDGRERVYPPQPEGEA